MSGSLIPEFAYGEPEFTEGIGGLLPPGPIWTTDPATVQGQVWAAIAASEAKVHARAAALLAIEADPRLTVEMLADWERAFGLPDECTVLPASLQERRASLLWKITAVGGQSRAYFIALAAFLGFTITIEEPRPFRVGISRAGDPLRGIAWIFAWRVHADAVTVRSFRTGASAVGEALRSWGNTLLECRLNQVKPAHTVLIFAYGS